MKLSTLTAISNALYAVAIMGAVVTVGVGIYCVSNPVPPACDGVDYKGKCFEM